MACVRSRDVVHLATAAAEQRAVLKVVDGFLDSFSPVTPRRRAAPPPRAKRKAS